MRCKLFAAISSHSFSREASPSPTVLPYLWHVCRDRRPRLSFLAVGKVFLTLLFPRLASHHGKRLYASAESFKFRVSAKPLKSFSLKHFKEITGVNTIAGYKPAHLCVNVYHSFLLAVGVIISVAPFLFCAPDHSVKETAGRWQYNLFCNHHGIF